jgi:flavin-dependent dehydrogenase
MNDGVFDVLICGGGLAGLTLARQLKLEMPQLSVAVVDRQASPLPEAAHKVGESSNELTAHYLGKVLGLEEYLRERQLPKFGLRYFFGDPHGPFDDRPEFGQKVRPPFVTGYQLDRGRLENDLRQMAAEMGVTVIENSIVDEIRLAEGDEPHVGVCRERGTGTIRNVSGRWIVDALGRRRLLQSKLGLMRSNGHSASAAWWRIAERVDIGNMGSDRFRGRVHDDRYYSTNHLMGRGYWFWLIPLSSGATSLGIVTDETIHPFQSYGRNYQQALEWLRQYEPAVLPLIEGREPLDFLGFKNYSYHSAQIFSHRRWSCIGEAGIFLDPFYSIGSDFIALDNTITVEMIRRDLEGELTPAAVDDFNHLVLDLYAGHGVLYYRGGYRTFGHPHVYAAKHFWDIATYWSVLVPFFVQNIVRRPSPEALALIRRYNELHERVQKVFIDWAEKAPPRSTYELADISRSKLHQMLYFDLLSQKTPEQALRAAKMNLDRLEEMAQVLFWQAVRECLPERLPQKLPWINAWAIGLDPEQWESDGLFRPETAPRPLDSMARTFSGVFGPVTLKEFVRLDLFYKWKNLVQGKPVGAFARWVVRTFVLGKPAPWIRKLFITDYQAPEAGFEAPARARAAAGGESAG